MFKIESYITPLLMGYLDKYVKLRPEDFQLSLWGGDAVLYNLDLRLDIIEKAVQLPIVFQSGHIHELRLHVPWTKLGSDPVVVTINTIECILKVRDTAYKERKSRASSETPGKSGQKSKPRKQESVDLPPGYLQSLMSKIMSNVSIIVNNLIVKFVEDDIVLSLNVKSAECYSVDKDWNRAFTELFAPDFVLRRTINFCDVTVCLDKRDASGKIEHYQDPIVYRCSIASRLYSKYENMHSKYPLETKLNVYCERLDLSLTDTQLPMLIRLIELCLALYYGTLEFKVESSESEPDQQSVDRESNTDSSVGEPPPPEGYEDDQGWMSWAWSYVPQILPEDEEEELQYGPPKKQPSLIFSLGLYAYKMSVKFKLTEYLKDKAHYGPKKIVFKPFLYLESDGISMEMLMQGLTFFDIQFGVTSLAIYSQGPCICGADGEENSRNNVLLSGGDNLANKTTTNYVCQSLFDQQSPENLGIPISKILDFDEHKQVYTEQYGVQKFGFFWMDMLYSMVKPESASPYSSSRSSVSSQDDSTVFIQENSLSRFVVGQSHLNISSTTVHRVQKLIDAAYKYEYEPYSKPQPENVDESRPHPTEEQIQSLEEYIPTRTYHLTLLQPIISVLSAEHAYCDIAKKSYRSSQHKTKPQQAQQTLHPLFGMQITSQRFDLQMTSPMYPRKLVQLVSKIAGPSSNLLHHCHSHTQMKLFGFQVGVTKVDSVGSRSPIVTVIPPTSGAMYTRKLLLTPYWTNSYLPKFERVYELPQMAMNFSKPALHVVMVIVSSWKQNNPKPADILASSLLDDVFPAGESEAGGKYPVIELKLSGFEMKSCGNDMVKACSATVSSIHSVLYRYEGSKTSVIPIFSCPCDTESVHTTDWLINTNSPKVEEIKNDCLMLTYQLPRKYDQVQAPAIVLLNVEGIAMCFSPSVQSWFNYTPVSRIVPSKEPKVELDLELAKIASPLQTNISQVSLPSSGSKRQTMSLTTPIAGRQSTLPAGNQESKPLDNQEQSGIGGKLAKIFPLIRVLQVQVEMKKACLFIPKQHVELEEPSMNIVGNFQTLARSRSLSDTLVICLPRVVVQSAGLKPMSSIPEIPITSVEGSLVGDKIPWNVSLQNCCVYTIHTVGSGLKALQLVKPATVSSTVGVSYKYSPPTSDTISALGLCLHTDMRSVTASTSLEQAKLLMEISSCSVQIVKQALDCVSEITTCLSADDKDSKSSSEPKQYQNQHQTFQNQGQTTSAASVSQSDIPYTQTSGELTSLDTPSKELEILETNGEGVKLSLWLQWTLPKCEMRLYLKGKQGEAKISTLLEDITMSVDVQDVYTKLKLNIGAVGISHFQRQCGSSQWLKGAQEGTLMSCRDNITRDTHIVSSRLWSGDHGSATVTMFQGSQPQREIQHGFFSLTLTRALRRNVKKRLQKLNIDVINADTIIGGDVASQFYFNKYISEICMNIAPCDFILCLEPVTTVLNCLNHLNPPRTKKTGTKSTTVEDNHEQIPILNTCNLPLIYADISNLRVFIPGEVTNSEECKGDKTRSTLENDMLLFQVQSMNITPHAENPLPRYAVDKELYQRALHLGITSESGAAMSDTQFQVDLKGLSFTSGCWSDLHRLSEKKSSASVVQPGTQIPAVEWNTLGIREEHEDVQLFPLLSPCDLKLILAPALVNYTPSLGTGDFKGTLVCGYGFEFNVVSDLDLHLSTNQIHLMHDKVTSSLKTLKLGTESNDENPDEVSSVQDSGIGSEGSAITVQRSTVKQEVRGQNENEGKTMLVPVDLLLTAGRISCTLYTHKKIDTDTEQVSKEEKHQVNKKKKKHSKQELEWRVDTGLADADTMQYEQTQFDDPYLMHMYQMTSSSESKVIPAGTTCLQPFLFLYITQPHTVLSCQNDHQKFETSCYDILVKGALENTLFPVNETKLLPDCSDFTEYWLETRPGHPHQSTGIPASLYTLNVVDFLTNSGKITLKIERPVRFNVSFAKIRQVEKYCSIVLPRQHRSEKPKTPQKPTSNDGSGNSAFLSNIGSIGIQTEQMVVAMETKPCDERPEVVFSFSNFKGNADIHHLNNGEIASLLLASYMRDVLIKTVFESRNLNMIGPCSVKVDGTYSCISRDNVHFLSQCTVTIATGLVTVHFGQEHALCLKMFAEHVLEFYKDLFPASASGQTSNKSARRQTSNEQTFQEDFIAHASKDDLRSGEFQYVMETDGMDELPRPGEIVFFNMDREGDSSMTWCYSEPRVISALSSTPVPFSTSGADRKVECVLQYWEMLIQQFVDLVEFDLEENEVTNVFLPDVRANNARDLIAAQIWRITVKNMDEETMFPPASLAAAMRIDSCFVPSLIPSIQLGLTMESAQLHLSNHVHCLGTETPTKLRPFFMSSCYQPTGEFAVISLDNLLLAGSNWNKHQARSQLQFSSLLNVDLLEYKTLTMEKVISPFEISGNCNLQNHKKISVVDMDMSCEPVTVRVGQGAVHNLCSSIQAWNQILHDEPSELEEVVFCHYVICNDTQQPIRFGQLGTDENLVLQSREMHQYGWRSHKMKQELHICLDGSVWKWCDAIDINKTGVFVRSVSSVDQQYTLVITIKRLSNLQNQIIISGLVTVSNRLSLHMEVKVITMETEHHAVAGSDNTIPSYVIEPQKIQGVKFRPWGKNGPWSKEVYLSSANLRENNLVKVTSGSKIFHIWCRVLEHTTQNIKQMFVVLCPLYTVRSHLPYPLYINIDTSKLNLHEQIEAPGRGRDLQLQCPGGDIHQSLTFQFSANSGKSSTSVTLSTGLIDQIQRSKVIDFNPNDLNNYWKNDAWIEWPYTGKVNLEENSPRPDLYNVTVTETDIGNQPTIDLNVNLTELWPGFQTLLVDVSPSYIIHNQCDLDLVFMGNEDVTYDIRQGQTICPPKLENSFHVGVKYGDTVHMSESIPVSEEGVEEQRYRNDLGHTLYINSYVNMPIYTDFQGHLKVYCLTIMSTVKNHIRIISIREQYVISNMTKHKMEACMFAVPTWSKKVNIPVDATFEIGSHLGCYRDKSDLQPLPFIPVQYETNSQRRPDIDQHTNLVNYLILRNVEESKIKTNGSNDVLNNENAKQNQSESFAEIQLTSCKKQFDWSFPIRVVTNEIGRRMTTSLSINGVGGVKQEPLCVTGVEKDGVIYITIQIDTAPACYIQNHCSFPLYFGQTLMDVSVAVSDATLDTMVQEETELVNYLPSVGVNGAVYYTPPFLNNAFPKINDKHSLPKIHVSGNLPTDGSEKVLTKVKWSNSIDLLLAADNFVSIPNVADVKVHVQKIAMVTHVTISPITKADVSAKEIRSRLKGRERTVVVESELVEADDVKIAQELKLALEKGAPRMEEKEKESETVRKALKMSVGFLGRQLSLVIQNESSAYSKSEIVRLTIEDLFFASYPASDLVEESGYHRNCLVCSAGDVQLDNQVQAEGNFDFPVVFVRQNVENFPYQSDHEQLSEMNILEKHAVLKCNSIIHAQVVFGSMNGRQSVIESVECAMKPLSFYIDDTFIFRCIKDAEGFLQVPLSVPFPLPVDILKLPSSVKSLSRTLSNPVTIGHISIQPVAVMFSIHASLKLFIASDHTPLSFGKFEKRYICTTGYQLTRVLVMHYASGALFRAGAVVGSLEILGNPTGLVRSIGTGVADFFRMPYRGLTRGPGAFVVGVSHGTSSMVRNITTGMLKSVTDFASSVSRNMDRLSLDGSHMKRQEESRRHRPDGVGEGLKQGLTGLGLGLLGAVAGLADQPIQSFIDTEEEGQSRKSAASGLVTGVGKGLVGIFTKPIGGAAEFVSQTGQGILHGTGLSKLPNPRTAPYMIDISQESCGQVKYALKLLQTLPSNDILCCMEADHIDLTEQDVPVTLILTPEILFVVNHEEDSQQQSFSILELECGVTQGEQPVLSIVWKDLQTFTETQHGPSKAERVTAFVDAASKYISTTQTLLPALADDSPQSNETVQKFTSHTRKTPLDDDRPPGSMIQGEQLSDTASDSSVEVTCATLPQYDFKMSATNLAAFLAIFNITKHKLTGVGFAV